MGFVRCFSHLGFNALVRACISHVGRGKFKIALRKFRECIIVERSHRSFNYFSLADSVVWTFRSCGTDYLAVRIDLLRA